jgi:glycerol-3-phosphate acyltransferase PlsY
MALLKKRFGRSGKGLATGAGALLAYDLRYFVAVVVIGLAVIALTRYMMAGQVVAAVTLPVAALVLRSPDLPFAVLMGALVYAAHHRRFVGLLKGQEPRFYIHDRGGPRG